MTPSTQHRDPIARALSLGTDGRSVKAWADVLGTIPLFAGLSQRHLRRVAGQATMKRYAPYTAIVRVDDPGDAFYVILDGSAAVRKPGKRSVKLHRGDFFGELALLDAAPAHGHGRGRVRGADDAPGADGVPEGAGRRAQGGAHDAADAGGAHARVGSFGSGLTRRRPCGH